MAETFWMSWAHSVDYLDTPVYGVAVKCISNVREMTAGRGEILMISIDIFFKVMKCCPLFVSDLPSVFQME